MRIENEIQVEEFPSVYQKVSINLIYTMTWADLRLQEFFGEFGMTSSQYNVLRILRGQHPKPVSTAFIRDRMIHRASCTGSQFCGYYLPATEGVPARQTY